MDIALVSLACFTLVWQLWPQPPASVLVKITAGDQSVSQYLVEAPSGGVERVRCDLVEKARRPVSPEIGWVKWRHEIADFYAQSNEEKLVAAVNTSQEQASEPTGVFRTVSTKAKSVEPDQLGTTQGRWVTFWQQESTRADQWLAQRLNAEQQRLARWNDSIEVSQVRSFGLPVIGWWVASLSALAVVIVGLVWRKVAPPRSWNFNASLSNQVADAGDSGLAAMQFRPEWVQLRQPGNVLARRFAGWALVLAALVVTGVNLVVG